MKKLLGSLFRLIPMRVQLFIGDLIGILWFDILRIRRRVALENLKKVYPDWTEAKRVRVARLSVQNIGRTFVETLRLPFIEPKDKSAFTVIGREHLTEALKRGRGAFLLSAHIGNGDWAVVGLALNGIQLALISKRLKWNWANEIWFKARRTVGTEIIADRNTSYAILKLLKKNGVIAFVLDQFMGPPIGVKTKFFGMETGTAMGLAVLAGRSGAAVVPVVTYRMPDGHTVVEFNKEIPFIEKPDPDETIAYMTQIYCDKLESFVRQFPEQWMWVHRRWKKFTKN